MPANKISAAAKILRLSKAEVRRLLARGEIVEIRTYRNGRVEIELPPKTEKN